MAREVVIVTWCDRCAGIGRGQVKAATHKGIGSNGALVEIDLCQDCQDEVLSPVLTLLDTYGRSTQVPARRRPAEGNFPCDSCERVFTTPQGVGAHRRKTHGIWSQNREAVRRRAKKESQLAALRTAESV